MQDMYLARRAEMAKMIAPAPDNPQGVAPESPLALLPAVSSSSFAETALTQALQTVATNQEQPTLSSQSQSLQTVKTSQEQLIHGQGLDQQGSAAWQYSGQRRSRGSRQDEEEQITQHPLQLAVPDQASLLHIK